MHHEPVIPAVSERFTLEVTVDVVLQLGPAGGVHGVGACRVDLVDRVADRVQSWLRISFRFLREERKKEGWEDYEPAGTSTHAKVSSSQTNRPSVGWGTGAIQS